MAEVYLMLPTAPLHIMRSEVFHSNYYSRCYPVCVVGFHIVGGRFAPGVIRVFVLDASEGHVG